MLSQCKTMRDEKFYFLMNLYSSHRLNPMTKHWNENNPYRCQIAIHVIDKEEA